MKKFLKILFVIILISVFSNTVFSSSWKINNWKITNTADNKKTIKELKEEVKIIDKKKEESDEKLDELKKDLLVKKFFKIDLSLSQKSKLNILIKNYKKKKQEINNNIIIKSKNLEDSSELKKELLINEKDFYWELLEYIDIKKYDEYLKYIKKNIEIINNKSNLNSSSAKKEIIIQNKVDNIKNKIKEHNNKTIDNTIILLNVRINKLLTKLVKKEKFKKLDNSWKIKLFDNLINAIDKKLENLKTKENKSKIQEIIINNKSSIIENIKIFKENILK